MDIYAELKRLGALIRQLQGALDGKATKVGTDSVTFTAAVNSAAKTVTHGLGTTPSSVQANGAGGVQGVFYEVSTITATTFDVVGFHPAGAISATYAFTWAAIG